MKPHYPLTRSTSPPDGATRSQILADPQFGRHFTEHMASAVWTPADGWHDRRIGPVEPLALHPGTAALHYAQGVFEGLKAYRHAGGGVFLFRPEVNARRFARSARRLALPELPEEDFLASVCELVRADEPWVPDALGDKSLYLRPFMFAADEFLGVRSSERVVYCVIALPAGPLFATGHTGITLWISSRYTRSAPGGTGEAKCGGNYAAGLAAQAEARQHGCDQVMYLDRVGGVGNLEESGTMNLFVVTSDGLLLTPPRGTILDGVTRDSVLRLAAEFELTPAERPIPLGELRDGAEDGRITEVFAAGTAAVITPVVGFKGEGYEITIGAGAPGKRTLALREHLLGVQHGSVDDRHGWMRRVL
jgi:branched-chain amino acid aminotransferase